jgi:hypothetical protein
MKVPQSASPVCLAYFITMKRRKQSITATKLHAPWCVRGSSGIAKTVETPSNIKFAYGHRPAKSPSMASRERGILLMTFVRAGDRDQAALALL